MKIIDACFAPFRRRIGRRDARQPFSDWLLFLNLAHTAARFISCGHALLSQIFGAEKRAQATHFR